MSDELPIVRRLRKQIKAVQNTTMPPECAPEIDAEDVEDLLALFTELVAALEPFRIMAVQLEYDGGYALGTGHEVFEFDYNARGTPVAPTHWLAIPLPEPPK